MNQINATDIGSGLASSLREAIDTARRMTRERAEAQAAVDSRWAEATGSAQSKLDRVTAKASQSRDTTVTNAATQRDEQIASLTAAYEAEHGSLDREYRAKEAALRDSSQSKLSAVEKSRKETNWLAEEVAESDIRQAREILTVTTERLKSLEADLSKTVIRVHDDLQSFSLFRPAESEFIKLRSIDFDNGDADLPADAPVSNLTAQSAVDRTEEIAKSIAACKPARFAQFSSLVIIGTIVLGVLVAAGLALESWRFGPMVAVGAGAGLFLIFVLAWLLRRKARSTLASLYSDLRVAAEVATVQVARELNAAHAENEGAKSHLSQRKQTEITRSNKSHDEKLRTVREQFEARRTALADQYRPRLEQMESAHKRSVERINLDCQTVVDSAEAEHDRLVSEAQTEFDASTTSARAEREQAQQEIAATWEQRLNRFEKLASSLIDRDHADFPAWTDSAWAAWLPPRRSLGAAKLGKIVLDLAQLPGGLPEGEWGDALQRPKRTALELPALLEMPRHASLLIEYPASDDRKARRDGDSLGKARETAIGTLQAVMLRMLTALPPAKCRFTIFDPVGLGQNFAGFMHLADYNDQFINHRIWTEARHIEARLSELTEHMENVIQKYLRNEFETIDDYNEQAGEIAEPYRFLVISDFPVNFDESSARRLASIVSSGARCGVHTLIACDTRENLPTGIQISDIRDHSTTLVWRNGHYELLDPVLSDADLCLEQPPGEDRMTDIVKRVGEAALDASRVEVPFKAVSPSEDDRWSRSSADDIRVPLGRAGATKLQELHLGRGTAQHVLLAGKTGSGKSTLLHVLITNLALWYSPREVEFYLVDFKKGVEFKAYAGKDGEGPLPHARAVAIESDREFGLSVLQRVDEELKSRGDLFRDAAVQNLAGFRAARPDIAMPRTLLIIDEFQELFVEDDKLAQDAALLLDRLVRQGRAFGIHVILGSQTLGGAYSLARSTLGQMAIRIALQCNEADSYLILNEENSAARLLSRPGEAIYNDQAGMVEGNSPFQIVWLPDSQRDDAIADVSRNAAAKGTHSAPPAIVFEGNIPAQLERNTLLRRAAALQAHPDRLYPQLWLGEAIAIKDPTAARLRRQSGSNLLVIGQREDALLGVAMSSIVSIAAQCAPGEAQIYIVDATPDDDPRAGQLRALADLLPHDARIVPQRDLEQTLSQIVEEVRERIASNESDAPAVLLLIHSMQRIRALRRNEDSFGFSTTEDETPKPDKLLLEALRDGPGVGVHVVLSCDTLTNTERYLDRTAMREIENRVLFQMSGGDSTQLIDSPAASRLGPNRAIFFSEESGFAEKFRPYAAIDADRIETTVRELGLL